MAGMRQFRGRYSPGCGGRLSERTLDTALQGDPAVQAAFEGFAPQAVQASAAALARPTPPPLHGGLHQRWTGFVSWIRSLLRLWGLI